MSSAFTGFIGAISIALIITALTMEGRQTPKVIDSIANGGATLMSASLGNMPNSGVRMVYV